MTEVTEAVKENVGKSSYVMRGFFEDLIGKGELIAYLVEVDKQTVVTDTEEEIIVRRTKGATLTSVNELREYLGGHIVEDSGTHVKYNLDIGCRGGMFFNDGESQIMYHHCVLERLTEELDLRRIKGKSALSDSEISIPKEFVSARLRVDYDEDHEGSHIERIRRSLIVEGEADELFKRFIEYLRN